MSKRATADATELFEALVDVLKRLQRRPLPLTDEIRDAWAGAAPAPRHLRALLQIAAEEPLGISELADRLGVSLATASLVVTDLDGWGAIVRTADASDRRRTLVSIAPDHRPLVDAIVELRLQPLSRTLRRLQADERAALLRGLNVLAEELEDAKVAVAR